MSDNGLAWQSTPYNVIAGGGVPSEVGVVGRGRFIVFEGADGSGKSAISRALGERLKAKGREIHLLSRSRPRSVPSFETYVRSVDGLFRSREQPRASLRLLALAAAGQYTALLESEVVQAVNCGAVVIAESWWGKTRARFIVEAERLGMPREERDDFDAWMDLLLPRWDQPQQHTFLVITSQEDRAAWYGAIDCRDRFYGRDGETSDNPHDFGVFTQSTQDLLEQRAICNSWVRVENHRRTTPGVVAARIEERLSL